MTHTPALPETDVALRVQRQAMALQALVAVGLNLAAAVERRVLAAEGDQDEAWSPAEVALSFSRIAKAVRQCLALEDHFLNGDDQKRAQTRTKREAEAAQALKTAREEGADQRDLASDAVIEAIETGYAGRERDTLLADLNDWLEDADGGEDTDELVQFAKQPVSVTVARICEVLGVVPDWSLWRHEDWAQRERRKQTPGSPYATMEQPPGAEVGTSEVLAAWAEPGAHDHATAAGQSP